MKILVTGSAGFIGNSALERVFNFKPQIPTLSTGRSYWQGSDDTGEEWTVKLGV